MKGIFISVLSLIILLSGFSQKNENADFKKCFEKYGVDGCFVLFDEANNNYIRYNSGLCDSGYIPASTFKIPNSLIALEEGIVKDTNQVFIWDGHEWPNKEWNQDQTLKTAMKYSCVWVFVGIAEKVGIKKYYDYIKLFDYGNKILSGQSTKFWLAGSLRISANQQIEFLRKFYNDQLGVSKKSADIVKDIIVLEKNDHYKLSGKTGGGVLSEDEYIMWLVGYVEHDNKVYYYAMNFKTNDYDKTRQARYDITKDILKDLKLIE